MPESRPHSSHKRMTLSIADSKMLRRIMRGVPKAILDFSFVGLARPRAEFPRSPFARVILRCAAKHEARPRLRPRSPHPRGQNHPRPGTARPGEARGRRDAPKVRAGAFAL